MNAIYVEILMETHQIVVAKQNLVWLFVDAYIYIFFQIFVR